MFSGVFLPSVFRLPVLCCSTCSSSAYQGQYLTSSPSHIHCILTSVFFFLGLFFWFFCHEPNLPSSALIWTLPAHVACWVFSLLLSNLKRLLGSTRAPDDRRVRLLCRNTACVGPTHSRRQHLCVFLSCQKGWSSGSGRRSEKKRHRPCVVAGPDLQVRWSEHSCTGKGERVVRSKAEASTFQPLWFLRWTVELTVWSAFPALS